MNQCYFTNKHRTTYVGQIVQSAAIHYKYTKQSTLLTDSNTSYRQNTDDYNQSTSLSLSWKAKFPVWYNYMQKFWSTHLCFLLLGCLGASLAGLLNMSKNIGSNFLNITVETAKFLSNLSTLSRNSCDRLAMSDHFFILLKNCIRLKAI